MLRRVVKDHSDIKNSLMMQTAASVLDLKEKRLFEFDAPYPPYSLEFTHFSACRAMLCWSRHNVEIRIESSRFFFHFNYRDSIGAAWRIKSNATHKIPIRIIRRIEIRNYLRAARINRPSGPDGIGMQYVRYCHEEALIRSAHAGLHPGNPASDT
ncbi:hypothetical protein [Burkholderia anthina]|uniref:hypothetical protein n=1 Tax=Burkholderia anthina TaxID=179879 RepID=UPI00158BE504|nr:hypothetical protein [Burkholderia anthina]